MDSYLFQFRVANYAILPLTVGGEKKKDKQTNYISMALASISSNRKSTGAILNNSADTSLNKEMENRLLNLARMNKNIWNDFTM